MTQKAMSVEESVRWLTDRAEIEDLITTLFRRVDARDYAGVAGLFTEDGEIVLPFTAYPVTELVAFSERIFATFQATHHMIGNVAVTVDGDVAHSHQYVRATHIPDVDEPSRHADVGGWYDWNYRRTPEGWRITRYELVITFADGIPFEPTP